MASQKAMSQCASALWDFFIFVRLPIPVPSLERHFTLVDQGALLSQNFYIFMQFLEKCCQMVCTFYFMTCQQIPVSFWFTRMIADMAEHLYLNNYIDLQSWTIYLHYSSFSQ